ncbi:hypothetical protein LAZ67_13001182 [Cordylochernes scorpioides]|uniref:Copia protein n=1 Tax=Cordylochernes scorpioides TaxID=51811 RepID=A0ABY6L7L2_9ARAC|nr:hypothetical protein LAZ67_13001182 [Cordylochernes scorpioides]
MAFAVTKLAQFCSNPGERHWQAAKHILRYLQATKNVSLIYKRGSDDILAFSDSDWANEIDDRRSTSGSAVTINGCLVSWRSKKQNCVSLSTMESEYIALAQTTKEILWIAQILENLKCLTNASRPITIFCDNRAAIEFSKNNIENNRLKHIDIRYHYIREKVNSGDIHVNYISTNDNLADIFTKGLKRTAHQNACAAMNCLDTGILHGISKWFLLCVPSADVGLYVTVVKLGDLCEKNEQCNLTEPNALCNFNEASLHLMICQCKNGFDSKDSKCFPVMRRNSFLGGTPHFDNGDLVPIFLGFLAAGLALMACCAGLIQLMSMRNEVGLPWFKSRTRIVDWESDKYMSFKVKIELRSSWRTREERRLITIERTQF